jgi:NAD(P)-dependent dehydrogenase (short-subunit alcohol dehydrogenase family)
MNWTAADVADQQGRVAVITGANAGIGFATATVLADKGARVVLAVRNLDKGQRAAERINAISPHADVSLQRLDLASLASVRTAAKELGAAHPRIDLLINNAGVMWTPKTTTEDGFELQFGTNHLGHFAFTGLLLDHLLPVAGSRVVTITSPVHRMGATIHFDDLQWEHRYNRIAAYAQAKLANLVFAYELQRRLAARGAATISVAAHPGGCYTEQVRNGPRPIRPLIRLIGPLVLQSPQMGALPILRAATDAAVRGGQYYAPGGPAENWGYPKLLQSSVQSHEEELARRLWAVSEELTRVNYPV